MQNKDFEIVMVEDDSLVSLDLMDRLESLGFTQISAFTSGEALLDSIDGLNPRVILMDIELDGKLDGVETIVQLHKKRNIPVVYLTDHVDEHTFQRALSTSPSAFLHKPFVDKQVAHNIEVAASQFDEERANGSSVLVPDGLFAFEGDGQYKKVDFQEIMFLKADRAYCEIQLAKRTLTMTKSMKSVFDLLRKSKYGESFIQAHRSYVINKAFIKGFNGRTLQIGGYSVPTTEYYIPDLKDRFFTI